MGEGLRVMALLQSQQKPEKLTHVAHVLFSVCVYIYIYIYMCV